MPKDLVDVLNGFLDKAEPAIEKAVGVVERNVHVPGKTYPTNPDAIDAEFKDVQEDVRAPIAVVFGGIAGRDGRGIIWHAFQGPGSITICGRNHHPETWWRPNPTSKEAILFCFGCLSRLAQLSPTRKELTDGK